MLRRLMQFRIRTFLLVVALVTLGIALLQRWRHCRERAELFGELAAMHRDIATFKGSTSWAVANQRRKALSADEIGRTYRWAAIIPILPLPDESLRPVELISREVRVRRSRGR